MSHADGPGWTASPVCIAVAAVLVHIYRHHAGVHPQDMSDSVFTETEMARAYREIGVRDPAFDMPAFLRQIKADVPTIIRAYLEGEIDVLKVSVPTNHHFGQQASSCLDTASGGFALL